MCSFEKPLLIEFEQLTVTGQAFPRHPPHVTASSGLPGSHQLTPPEPTTLKGPRRVLFLALAGLFFATGVVGVILPILPTTPFLLLSSFFLVRSSPRLHSALLGSRLFGPILTDWQFRGGVRRDVKFKAIGVVVVAVAATIFLSEFSMIPTVTVALLATVGIGVILRLPTARQPSHSPTRAGESSLTVVAHGHNDNHARFSDA
jgi:uncharacterized membrane protein YbaN (DUF454 family)